MLTGVNLRADIFKESKDHADWSKYLGYLKREPSLTKERREELIETYMFLRNELGREYLKRPFKDGRELALESWGSLRSVKMVK